ncbi:MULTISPECIES: transcription elongation factor GreA [Thermoanaerobacterium]|uniref:Transcription elongation factor GreA n=1 Tax=Thermoanaerobacterium butyriciformans TaxID=1702242 RepID=A0ABS4NEI7_9THEO|nr:MULTISPECIES: transcription elongation factor GreA [Thermoanaerobacterium]WHE07485.1 transcription elongation factor GreA [Thermoanaerobacterium thermosaccharolyticum]HHV73806.1 transcription elongation factor GreA [Thermoanaerobacterium sp.]MBP2072071.1 transcription elongation factor GreA [Thermoanaerobacterium butyriciformans]MDE4543320.1 transcription elongation factor GreA [Thermoanaerobacterium sp. R66]ORX23285.1 transcription elongation factor GreA [Thermoanaerobacterium sp. PSU-2]
MGKQVILTYDGLKKLEEELDYLKSVKRPEVAEKIKQARAFGDLSENSEYDEAKNEQAFIEGRIATIEAMLRNAQVIDEEDIAIDKVSVGCTVKVYDEDFKEEAEYTIVGSTEADPMNNKISDESPIGKALLGKKVGDTVSVEVPAGIIKLKVLEIHK